MSKAKWLLAAGLVAVTAGCVEQSGAYQPRATYYPSGSSSYPASSSTSASSGYWNSPTRDYDRDGIPNRYDHDANGDRVPDRYQR